ncbi:unnamed protein product [Symbiodinium sp. CCMP2592]|nr:unnamed protein product [Symbiodinium sp. CCMP2592]
MKWKLKELHKETTTKHSSITKTSEKVGELEDEPFRKVEEALKIENSVRPLMLGNSKAGKAGSSGDGPQLEEEKPEEEQPEQGDLYKKAVQGLRKAVNAYSSTASKVTTMLASLEKATPEVQADPQHAVSKIQLGDLGTSSSKERNRWNTVLARWPATWAGAAGFFNEAEKVEEVQLEKSKREKALKELNKVLAPTKVWAKGKLDFRPEKGKELEALGDELKGLYTSNAVTARKAASVFKKAHDAGLGLNSPFDKAFSLRKAAEANNLKPAEGSEGSDLKPAEGKNAARTLQRWMRKNSTWPDLYWAEIPLKSGRTKEVKPEKMPFLLPHEWLADYFLQPGAVEEAFPAPGSPLSRQLGESDLGMNQSTVDFLTINLMASNAFQAKRVPITCVESRFVAGRETIEAVQQVIAWSLQSLGEGRYPSSRHDGESLDKARQSMAGLPMAARGGLVQLRGDWDWNCKYFGAPQWNELKGMCWLCKAKPENWRGMYAEDRQNQSLSKAEFEESLRDRNKHVSPLFGLPGVCNKTMKPDWMHVVDEGCGAHAAGHVLNELLAKFPDRGVEKRAERLWEEVQSLYKAKGIPACRRLKKLTAKDIVKPGKAPELAAKAAETRYFCTDVLLPLVESKRLQEGSLHDQAVYNVAKYCAQMYQHMEDFDPKRLQKSGEKFMSQYMALEEEALHLDPEDSLTWRGKPKLRYLGHLLDEARKGIHPKDFWNYRDETEGYHFQKLWFRAGGVTTRGHQTEQVLLKWGHDEPFFSLKEAVQ